MKMNGTGFSSCQNHIFNCKLLSKSQVKDTNAYILNSAVNKNSSNFAVSLSNFSVSIYDTEKNLIAVTNHEKPITNIKFSTTEPKLLFSSSLDGKINLWDTRYESNKPVQSFWDDSDNFIKPLTCFDYNLDEQLVCAGTELIREDSFLLFWDRRSSEILGGYWNSHTDEITHIEFHPSCNSSMASSSVDGLINIYDLNEGSEEDALTFTLNISSGINKFHWRDSSKLSCTTAIEEYQLWSTDEASPTLSVSRDDLTKTHQVKVDYLIDSFYIDDSWILATGTYEGIVNLWSSDEHSLKLISCLSKGHTDVVRTISYNSKENILLTGGEDGLICHWKMSLK